MISNKERDTDEGGEMKRWRSPKAKDGELKVQYGKLPLDSPDIIYVGGNGTSRPDRRLLHYIFSLGHFDGKSLYEELESRGYDLTTLKFSIQKKFVTLPQPTKSAVVVDENEGK